ncbi:hypothetical protein C8C76_13216 [Halanaerobium saccharolyticum]|uniref:Uncharacterized protein n=1 Tax=Halanaerobium saccharolyticum TaxID=43595 RepID=A0A2T5RGX1_9FIRM|nr:MULTISPECIES: hypothetical protein [Halanaerobium]PTV94442.1 hypothetical protein C8C76_13216 [Halanaerobium saccharolyticum]PUU88080.1 MAG: hypothetical protein CI949_3256 [Halanaerobium sp.]
MKKVTKLENYRKKKKEEKLSQIDENGFREIPEDELAEMLDRNGDLKLDSDDYDIYDEEFIQENAEHIAHHTLPFCTVCDSPLKEGDRVDSLWPMQYRNNICNWCQDKLPKKIKNKGIVNLEKLELVLIEEDYKKIKEHLNKKDIYNIEGHQIITEDLFQKIKYQILNG